MSKAPNEDKNTTFLRQCLTSPSVKADLSALYSPNDLFVEQVEFEDMRTYHVYAQCSLPYGVCPYCGCVSHRVHSSNCGRTTHIYTLCKVLYNLYIACGSISVR